MPTKNGIVLFVSRYKILTEFFDNVDNYMHSRVDTPFFNRYFGGNYCVSIKDGNIDLRKWWIADGSATS